jgi:phosphate transport system substrate-binding protein
MNLKTARPILAAAAIAVAASLSLACSSNNNNSSNNKSTNTNTNAPATVAAPLAATTARPPTAAAVTSPAAGSATRAPSPATAGGTAAAASSAVTCATGTITAVGSTALQPLVEAAAKQYQTHCSGANVTVQGGGSGTGLSQVAQGAANIGNSDIFAEDAPGLDPKTLVDHQVVKQGFVQVVNPSVTGVKNLTQQQSIDIWTGKTKNWKDVGGPDQAIVLIIRPASSGTRATFKKVVLKGMDEADGKALTEDSSGAVSDAVKGTPGSISVLAFAYVVSSPQGLVTLQYEGVDPSVPNIVNETYKIFSYGHMYTKGEATGLTKAFLDYMLTPEVQNGPVKELGYAPIKG